MPDSSAPPATDALVAAIVARYRDAVIAGMRSALDLPGVEHTRYMRYHLGWDEETGTQAASGKMLRPALCLLCCEAAGGNAGSAMPAAIAIELLHNFTLIHDDIEDRSDVRHGRETLWRRVGIAQAINSGDGMYTLARRTLLDLQGSGVAATTIVRAARSLDDACIALCEGQYLDLSFESRDSVSVTEYLAMVGGKSAALVAASCSIGALVAGAEASVVRRFADYGRSLGLAFQVQDDILGIWGDPVRTGKPRGDDIRARKKSFPIVHAMSTLHDGARELLLRRYASVPRDDDAAEVEALLERAGSLEAASAEAQRHADAALEAISELALAAHRRADLEALARFVVARDA